MIYVTGDTHAFTSKWMEQIDDFLKADDIIIVCGDFGVGFWGNNDEEEEEFYDFISGRPYTVLFIDGNHENFNKLYDYPVTVWNQGRAHKIRHNLIHLIRGEIYNIEGEKIFAFGGGYSLDKFRRRENISWWPQEMPNKEEYENARNNLKKHDYKVDYVITHTAPSETVYYLSTIVNLGVKGNVSEELPLTLFFDDVRYMTTYSHWYFGHFHVDRELWRNQTAILSMIRELKSGEIVKEWYSYEAR